MVSAEFFEVRCCCCCCSCSCCRRDQVGSAAATGASAAAAVWRRRSLRSPSGLRRGCCCCCCWPSLLPPSPSTPLPAARRTRARGCPGAACTRQPTLLLRLPHPACLQLLEQMTRAIRGLPAPFGGLRLVLCGDFFQASRPAFCGVTPFVVRLLCFASICLVTTPRGICRCSPGAAPPRRGLLAGTATVQAGRQLLLACRATPAARRAAPWALGFLGSCTLSLHPEPAPRASLACPRRSSPPFPTAGAPTCRTTPSSTVASPSRAPPGGGATCRCVLLIFFCFSFRHAVQAAPQRGTA